MTGDLLSAGVKSILLIPLYARFMTPTEYGLFGTVNTIVIVLGIISMLGLQSAVSRFYFIYKANEEENRYLASIWIFQIAFSIGLTIILVLNEELLWQWAAPNIPKEPYFLIVILGVLLAFSSIIYSTCLRAQERPWPFFFLQLLSTIIYILLTAIFLIGFKWGALGAICAGLGGSLATTILAFAMVGRKLKFKLETKYIKESIVYGGWMMTGTLAYTALDRSQILILQHYADLGKVGILTLGLQLSGVIMMISASINKAWQPHIFSSSTSELASETMRTHAKHYVAGMVFSALVLSVLARDIVLLLAGRAYAETSSVLVLLVGAAFLQSLAAIPSSALLYERRAGLVQLFLTLSALITILLSMLLVPVWQMTGAAVSILVSSFLFAVMSYMMAQRILWINYNWRDIGKVVGIGCLLFALASAIPVSLIIPYDTILRLVIISLYPVGLITLGVFRYAEVQSISGKIFGTLSHRVQQVRDRMCGRNTT